MDLISLTIEVLMLSFISYGWHTCDSGKSNLGKGVFIGFRHSFKLTDSGE